MKKHWVSNAFCYILELLGGQKGEYISSNLKWMIYTILGIFYFINFICSLWSLFIFHLSEMVTEPKEE